MGHFVHAVVTRKAGYIKHSGSYRPQLLLVLPDAGVKQLQLSQPWGDPLFFRRRGGKQTLLQLGRVEHRHCPVPEDHDS